MILDELAAYAVKRVEQAKKKVCMEQMREAAINLPKGEYCFEHALSTPEMSFICELKKASPSLGIISEDFPYLKIAQEYESSGTDCISCLTEPKWFLGSDQIFCDIRSNVSVPMLRKDFTVDEYQIYEAKCMGADAVLLICSLLDTQTLARYLEICDEMGICALVETHDQKEIERAVSAGARIIGVNNRNLQNFSVDLANATRLRDKIPSSTVFVAESGVHSPADVASLKAIDAAAVLIGEAMMRAADKRIQLAAFRRAAL